MNQFKNAFNVQMPIFKPLWLRLLIIVLCFGWAIFEWTNHQGLWTAVFGAAGAYLVHQWLFFFDPKEEGEDDSN